MQKPHWRLSLLGWGSMLVGAAMPLGAFMNVLVAMQFFSLDWAGDSIFLTVLLGSVLGYVNWSCGRGILSARLWAFDRSCVAGGMTFGYTVFGIVEMATSGRDRTLLILIRHGSENWWDWSFSHFQNSALRETPFLAWSVMGIGAILRYPMPGAPDRFWSRVTRALGLIPGFIVIGMAGRSLHLAFDSLLSSQR